MARRRRKKKVKAQRHFKLLRVLTSGVPGDTCPKRGGEPLRLGGRQCVSEEGKHCKYYMGLGLFVTIKCAHPSAPTWKTEPKPETGQARLL